MRKHVATYSLEAISIGAGIVITALGIWAGLALIVIGVAGLLWSRFGKDEPAVVLHGSIRSLERVSANDVALHRGNLPTEAGSTRVLARAVFAPKHATLPVSSLKLDVSGVELETESPPTEVHKGESWEGFFEIPESLEVPGMTGRLVALVGTERFTSPEFRIPFDKLGE